MPRRLLGWRRGEKRRLASWLALARRLACFGWPGGSGGGDARALSRLHSFCTATRRLSGLCGAAWMLDVFHSGAVCGCSWFFCVCCFCFVLCSYVMWMTCLYMGADMRCLASSLQNPERHSLSRHLHRHRSSTAPLRSRGTSLAGRSPCAGCC